MPKMAAYERVVLSIWFVLAIVIILVIMKKEKKKKKKV